MSGILWLASFPKSGNTWLRAFLANLLSNAREPVDINALPQFGWGDAKAELYERVAGKPVTEMSDEEIHLLRPRVHRLMVTMRNGDTLLAKTHNAVTTLGGVSTITPDATAGAIYVIRNPLDVTASYASHFGLSIDDTIEAMAADSNFITTSDKFVFQMLRSWSSHVRSWTEAPGLDPLVVRYEDMARKPGKTFGRVVRFLGLPSPPDRVERAIRFSNFRELARQESKRGFVERSANAERFFRQGRAGTWRGALAPAQVQRVIEAHRDVMRSHGYLDARDRVVA